MKKKAENLHFHTPGDSVRKIPIDASARIAIKTRLAGDYERERARAIIRAARKRGQSHLRAAGMRIRARVYSEKASLTPRVCAMQ